MTETSISERELLAATSEGLMAAHLGSVGSREGGWHPGLWQEMEKAGLTLVGIGEERGGSGGSALEAAVVLKVAGRQAAPVPLAETMLAAWLLDRGGVQVPEGPLSVALGLTVETSGRRRLLTGTARSVPWARVARRLVVLATDGDQSFVALVDPKECRLELGENLAGEPRDDVGFDGAPAEMVFPAPPGIDADAILCRGALCRAVLIAGALEAILDLALTYAADRHQFGRPLSHFQAVQHHLALLAEEVAAASAAVDLAVAAGDDPLLMAAAKVRAGEAAGTAAAIAHQIHGAIGFTEEHPLHHWTRRLWSWRDEFGHEAYWAVRLGSAVAARGADEMWSLITSWP